jgi:hypothetical protein
MLKTLIWIVEDGSIVACDTIRYQGKLWLVPEWLKDPATGIEHPARIICMDGLPLGKPPQRYASEADFHLLTRLSKNTLSGQSKAQGLVVVDRPLIDRNDVLQ